jgi:pimeloyl-ACP methyl ester carboxylesterase
MSGEVVRSVSVRGASIHVREYGSAGERAPVVLLHGWPQHWYEWRHLIPELAERHRVLAVDLRGFGWSDAPPLGYEKEELASDILALLDALGIDRVKLVGHDWGGWIGFLLCLRAPERFDRFLALGITHPWQSLGGGWRDLPRFWYQQVIITPGLGYALHRTGRFVRAALRSGVGGKTAFDDNLAEPARARACVRLYRSFNFRELLPVIRGRYMSQRLTVPTRLIVGTEDAVLSPRLITGWESHADDMSAEFIPGCGHFIADERPDLVAAEARALFA